MMLARVKEILHLPPISYPSGKGWFVVYTNPRCEARAQMGLDAKGFETFLPMFEDSVTRWRGKRKAVVDTRKPLFSRYLFVSFDPNKDEWWDPIKSTDGVEDILSWGPVRIPSRVPSGAIEALKRAEGNGVFDFRTKPCGLVKGDRVRLAEGPFAGFIGELLIAKPNKRAEVLLSVFGRANKVVTYLANLEKV